MDQEGIAGDWGGEEEGGGQTTSSGLVLYVIAWYCMYCIVLYAKKQLFQEIESVGPLTGLGFFEIERKILTSMVSTAVTYIIILVQFKMSTI